MNLEFDLPSGNENELNVVIEIQRGSRNKYEYDKKGYFKLDRVVPEPLVYPCDYGFVPSTLCEDGDSLDVCLINRDSIPQGCIVTCRIVGMFNMNDSGETDNKLICVPKDDPYFDEIKDIKDVPKQFCVEVKYFMEHYKDLKNKKVTVGDFLSAKEAKKELEKSIKTFQEKHKH